MAVYVDADPGNRNDAYDDAEHDDRYSDPGPGHTV